MRNRKEKVAIHELPEKPWA